MTMVKREALKYVVNSRSSGETISEFQLLDSTSREASRLKSRV